MPLRDEPAETRDPALLPRRSVLLALASIALGSAACGASSHAATAVAPRPRRARPSAPPVAEPRAGAREREEGEAVEAPDAAEAPDDGCPELDLPPRARDAETGSAFFARAGELKRVAFERAVLEEIRRGNLPPFLRRLARVRLSARAPNGERLEGEAFVLRDYLAIGSDEDFLRIPLSAGAAQLAADALQCVLPTRRLVDEIHRQAEVRLPPVWIEGGPTASHRLDFVRHHEDIEAQRAELGWRPGQLLAGHMKDVVLSNKLLLRPDRVAIYGWHRAEGDPIQPLSTAHGARYTDYSHGIRLVFGRLLVAGEERRTVDVLRSRRLSPLLSDEGPLEIVAYPTEPSLRRG